VECEEVFRRLISTPRKAKGAQQAIDHDLLLSVRYFLGGIRGITDTPQRAMMMVALLKLVTKGAHTMLPAKIQ
jgi:hypothetical protein